MTLGPADRRLHFAMLGADVISRHEPQIDMLSQLTATEALNRQLRVSFFTAFFSLIFAVVGFGYNAWRIETTERNDNVRTASFVLLETLAELEQVIYANHYDGDLSVGSPRHGWVKIGLISDLSMLIDPQVETAAGQLKDNWSGAWGIISDDRDAVDELVLDIDGVRAEIQRVMADLN